MNDTTSENGKLAALAHSVGLGALEGNQLRVENFQKLKRFAALVAAAEREACAQQIEQLGIEGYGTLAIAAAVRLHNTKEKNSGLDRA